MQRRAFLASSAALGASLLTGCKREEKSTLHISRGRKIRIKLATSWPANFPIMGEGVEEFAKRVAEATDNEVQIKVFAKNLLVPALGVFDACSAGQIDAFHSGPYYWKGKNAAFSLFGGFPFGFTSNEMNAWMMYGGGLEIWRKLYAKYTSTLFLAATQTCRWVGGFAKR